MQALREPGDGDVSLGAGDFVVASVEVEGFDGELGVDLVPVADLRPGTPERDRTRS